MSEGTTFDFGLAELLLSGCVVCVTEWLLYFRIRILPESPPGLAKDIYPWRLGPQDALYAVLRRLALVYSGERRRWSDRFLSGCVWVLRIAYPSAVGGAIAMFVAWRTSRA